MANATSVRNAAVNRGYSPSSLHHSHRSSTTSSGPNSSINSYFSAHAPSISSVTSPTSSVTSPTSLDYPVITATVTSRNSSGETSTSNMTAHEQALREFALHIPNPPMLSMAAANARHQQQSQNPPIGNSLPAIQSPNISRTVHTPGYDDLPSPMDRSRRMPPSTHAPQMTVSSSCYYYTLCVKLPAAIQPEMVTVCANKGDKLKVVADVWHLENESASNLPFSMGDNELSYLHIILFLLSTPRSLRMANLLPSARHRYVCSARPLRRRKESHYRRQADPKSISLRRPPCEGAAPPLIWARVPCHSPPLERRETARGGCRTYMYHIPVEQGIGQRNSD